MSQVEDWGEVEGRLGYIFSDKSRLALALTHASYRNENPEAQGDNERYEFLGDAVLDLVVGKWLFERFPAVGEGVLTEKKAALVCESSLARLAQEFGLGAYLRLGRGEELSGGREKKSLLANAMEAVVAAVFLDSDYERVNRVVLDWVVGLSDLVPSEVEVFDDPRSRLQNLTQARFGILPEYEVEAVDEDTTEPAFEAKVVVPGENSARGRARTKKGAMREAATAMLRQIGEAEQAGAPLLEPVAK